MSTPFQTSVMFDESRIICLFILSQLIVRAHMELQVYLSNQILGLSFKNKYLFRVLIVKLNTELAVDMG